MYTTVYWPCTRPCIWRVHGLVTAVYTYACVHGCVHGRIRAVSDRVDGCVRAVYRDASRVQCSCAVCYYDFFFAKDTFYAETYSYKCITFKKS